VKDVLPQGSPASPALSNLVSLKLDKRLSRLAETIGADYTRYADDITLSGNENITNYVDLVRKIISEEGYEINEDKFRLQYSFQRQEVTGLVVNTKVSVSEKLISEIENAIYYCNKYGVVDHMVRMRIDKGFYKEHLYGIAYFVKMIDKAKGEKYLSQLDKIDWPI
jgi:retron-type reverse transcriptase